MTTVAVFLGVLYGSLALGLFLTSLLLPARRDCCRDDDCWMCDLVSPPRPVVGAGAVKLPRGHLTSDERWTDRP